MKKLLTAFLLLFILPAVFAFIEITIGCPPEGRERPGKKPLTEEEKEFNRKKNRSCEVPAGEPKVLTIEQLLQGKVAVNDSADWEEGTYVEINDAYLIDMKPQKGESCNCYEGDTAAGRTDLHINIGRVESLTEKNNDHYMVVEITPAYKTLHPDHKTHLDSLKGKKVTVRGYLFYDSEHWYNSVNYCRKCTGTAVWRKTCWEIHPVTYVGETK
jgi:hypothetical protein